MINIWEVNETNKMIEHENLDVRTITLGISLYLPQDHNGCKRPCESRKRD